MPSEVDICNLALCHLGDVANVQAISPPDGSAQAAHCARFYPIARDALLEMHQWGFATTRASLAPLATNPTSSWKYAYGAPSGVVNYISILNPDATDDYSVGVQMSGIAPYQAPIVGMGIYTPQPFAVEKDDNGNDMILTNVQNAVLRYTQLVTDTSKFSPLFVTCLGHHLAAMLAGPILKGQTGRDEAKAQMQMALSLQAQAEGSDANQRNVKPAPGAIWITNR